jgi:hypothetical protein
MYILQKRRYNSRIKYFIKALSKVLENISKALVTLMP